MVEKFFDKFSTYQSDKGTGKEPGRIAFRPTGVDGSINRYIPLQNVTRKINS
jgi:hypothetical protein